MKLQKNISSRECLSTRKIFCFFIIYALQKLHMQYQSFPDTITRYIFTNNGKRSTKPITLMKINIYLMAFTAAVFNKIVLDDCCTWWWSSKLLQRCTCLHHEDCGMTQYPVLPLALCGLAQQDSLNTISFNIHYVN